MTQKTQASEVRPTSEVSFDDLDDRLPEEVAVIVLGVVAGGERLDKWLAGQLPDRSRSEIQRWIEAGLVTRGMRVLKASYRVADGDTITVEAPEPQDYEVVPEAIPLDVVYEDADLLVINKVAGMVVHPAVGNWHGTLVNAILHRCPDLEGVGGLHRPGIVHRLDKDTSGLILVAKNDRAHRILQAQFQAREVKKTYLALAYGRVVQAVFQIDGAIGRDVRDRKRMMVLPAGQGRAAVTRFEVLGYYDSRSPGHPAFGDFTLLACQPFTGRTHQIRVHLASVRHPIVGDATYGGKRKPFLPCPRQFLHAYRLRFRLPGTGQEVEFSAPLPEDLQHVLDGLRGADDEKRVTSGPD